MVPPRGSESSSTPSSVAGCRDIVDQPSVGRQVMVTVTSRCLSVIEADHRLSINSPRSKDFGVLRTCELSSRTRRWRRCWRRARWRVGPWSRHRRECDPARKGSLRSVNGLGDNFFALPSKDRSEENPQCEYGYRVRGVAGSLREETNKK